MLLVMRISLLVILTTVNTCGAIPGSSPADLDSIINTTVKDLQSSEALCSAVPVHPALCDSADALVAADVMKLQSAAGNWQPPITQVVGKDALTAATQSNLNPTTSIVDTRVLRLLLERVQPVLAPAATPLASEATAESTLPPGYAKQLQLLLPGIASEVSGASDQCSTPAIESCEVDVLIAGAGVSRVQNAYSSLVVTPADAPVDAVLKPMLGNLASQLGTAASQLATGMTIDPADSGMWFSDAQEFTMAAVQLAS